MHTQSIGLSVEEKIQLAMAQGDFDNLRGKGKPLERYSSEGAWNGVIDSIGFCGAFGRLGRYLS